MQPEQADRKYDDFHGSLTDAQLAAHLAGQVCFAVPYVEAGLGNVLAFDIDAGGMRCAIAIMIAAEGRGLWSFGQVDEARDRGYVYLPFDELVNGERLRALGNELIASVQRQGWRIENRATNEDTRLPLARHRWTGRRGTLIVSGARLDLDADPETAWDELVAAYRENPTERLPPPPEPARKPAGQKSGRREGQQAGRGYTISMFNDENDLVGLLESYGAKRARGQGRRLYFCPFHDDDHASLLINADGDRCRCMSEGSDCPLSSRQWDAFHVFCTGERINSKQALRRLNGLPDDPEPPKTSQNDPGRAERRSSTRERTPRATPQAAPASQESKPDLLAQAVTDPNLTRATIAVLRGLLDRADGQLQVYGSVAQYAASAACSERSARSALRRLEEHGYLRMLADRGRDGQTNVYRILWPEGRQNVAATCIHETHDPSELLAAERGGLPSPLDEGAGTVERVSESHDPPKNIIPHQEAIVSRLYHKSLTDEVIFSPDSETPALEATDGVFGPFGAFVCPGGAAYVPPDAASWYAETFGHEPDEAAFSASQCNRITDFTLRVRLSDTFCADDEPFAGRSIPDEWQQDAAEVGDEAGAEGAENVSLPRETLPKNAVIQTEESHCVSPNVHASQCGCITESHSCINAQVSLSLSHLHTHTLQSVCVSGERDPDETDEKQDRTGKKKRRSKPKPFDPNHLVEKIAIAEQKVRKLLASRRKADQRQAYAIQQSIQQLKYRLDTARDEIGIFSLL